MRQIILQRALLAAGGLILIDRLLELGQIVQPLLTALGAQHFLIAAAVQQRGEHLGDRPARIRGGELLDQRDKPPCVRPAERLVLQIALQRLIERAVVLRRIFPQKPHPFDAQLPPWHIGDARKGKIVLIRDHPQVGQSVLDLLPVKELRAAVNHIGQFLPAQHLFEGARDIMRAVEHGDVAQRHALRAQRLDLRRDPRRLANGALRMVIQHRLSVRQGREQLFFDPVHIFIDQRVDCAQHLRRRAVVGHHQDGLAIRKLLVQIKQVFDVCPAPGINGLIRIADHEQVFVITAQRQHELILQLVDVLKLVDHDVFQPLLPFAADVLVLLEDVKGELDQVVVIQTKALFLLVQIAVKNDVVRACRILILFMQRVERHGDQVAVIFRLLIELLYLDHIARIGKRHIPQRQPALFIHDLQHGVDIRIVQHHQVFGVLHRVAVLVQHRDAKAVEGADIACVVVPDQLMDALPHLAGRLVGKGHAQDMAGQDAQRIDQIGIPPRERPGLARARARDHADDPLGRCHSPALRVIQFFQKFCHPLSCSSRAALRTRSQAILRPFPALTSDYSAFMLRYPRAKVNRTGKSTG